MQHAIEVENVSKAFGDVKALNGIDLVAPEGQVLGLLGPNGAGKTTLVRIITTLLQPDSGSVQMAGIDVLKYPERVRPLFGLAGQYPAVDEHLTGRENLAMVGQLYHFSRKVARTRAQALLEQFTLTDAGDRPVKTYSGGMRRRLDLAASIVAAPRILLLDEPTTGLDPRTRIDMWNAIRQLVADGTTLLLTTQYLEEADVLADRIVLIDNGRTIAEGTSDELKARLAKDVVELRVSNQADIAQTLTLLAGIGRESATEDEHNHVISLPVENGAQSLVEVVRVLDGANIAIADIALRRPSLDDVFLTLTGQGEKQPA